MQLSSLLSALNPLLVLIVGYILNSEIQSARLVLDRNKAQIDENTAKIADAKVMAETATEELGQRVDKVGVIRDFLTHLSGDDERKRRLAIEAIFIAMPDEAARLVKAVEGSSPAAGDVSRQQDKVAATDALANRRNRLVQAMFSDARPVRVEALRTLRRGWADDEAVALLLIARAMQDVKAREAASWARPTDTQGQQRLASIYNVTAYLTAVRQPWSEQLKSAAGEFLLKAAQNSDDTRALIKSFADFEVADAPPR